MGRRMIECKTWKSYQIGQLTLRQRLLWIGLITIADDQGRGCAHPGIVQGAVFPYDEISWDEIQADLDALADLELIHLYPNDDGAPLYQIVNWWKYQRPTWAWPSDLPAPEGWSDREKYRKGNEVIESGWEAAGGFGPDDDEPTVTPERPHDDPTASPAPSTSGSTRTSDSKTLSSANADYQAVRQRWIELFPDKPTPRESNKTLTGKVKTRMKDADFRDKWEEALERASQSQFLRDANWFYIDWFLKNDDHWHRCLIGKYDDKGQRGPPSPPSQQPPKSRKVVVEMPDGTRPEVEVGA